MADANRIHVRNSIRDSFSKIPSLLSDKYIGFFQVSIQLQLSLVPTNRNAEFA